MQLPQVSAYGVQVLFGFVGQHRADLKQDAGRRGSIGSFPEVGGDWRPQGIYWDCKGNLGAYVSHSTGVVSVMNLL